MDDHDKRTLFKDEYLHLQGVIEDFDGRMLTIKAWSVSFSLAALGGAFATDSAEVFLIASLSALMFWLIEGFWKTFQYAHYKRSGQLEDYFAGKQLDLQPMQIGRSWFIHWKKGGVKRLFRIMSWPHVALPHIAAFVLGVALYVAVMKGWIKV